MEKDLRSACEALNSGGTILYPTDTVWGLGCDATNAKAVQKIYSLKNRMETKSMIILLDSKDKLPLYVKKVPLIIDDLLAQCERPTTFVYPNAINLPQNLVAEDGSIAIRVVTSGFAHDLISAFGKPIVSTSANISGEPTPQNYQSISEQIKTSVDYLVKQELNTSIEFKPSRIILFKNDFDFNIIRD